VLQRKCGCGGSAGVLGECDGCGNQKLSIQRSSLTSEFATEKSDGAPPIVHEVLRSPGQPLDSETRAYMEPRFGHDFGRVRIHADSSADRAAKATRAAAFTVGNEIGFASGRFAPGTVTGQMLLAHELAHVVQQRDSIAGPAIAAAPPAAEVEADQIASAFTSGMTLPAVSKQSTISFARYPADEPGDAPEVGQLLCVSRLGGCASARSGGLPTPQEIANYNVTCRRETSYSGPDLTPSDEQCRNPPQMPSSSLIFARSLATLYPGWLSVLPNCPCTDAQARSSSAWAGPGACEPPYHIGAATGYRSTSGYASVPGTNHGQQCCYDSAGLLITEGAGAGTPDIVQAPAGKLAAITGTVTPGAPGLGAAWSHYWSDVVPFNDLGWEIYNRYWVPNNGNNCPVNRKP
jgi:hypothetical protein